MEEEERKNNEEDEVEEKKNEKEENRIITTVITYYIKGRECNISVITSISPPTLASCPELCMALAGAVLLEGKVS